MISIDFRESDLLELAKKREISDQNVRGDAKMTNGDLHLCAINEKAEYIPIVILERKKISDFKASIQGRRWQEQR